MDAVRTDKLVAMRPGAGGRAVRALAYTVGMLVTALLVGCAKDRYSNESALSPAGVQAEKIGDLAWVFLAVCTVVFVLVMLFLALALIHRRHGPTMGPSDAPVTEPEPGQERRMWRTVIGAVVVTVAVLFGLLFADFATGRSIHALATNTGGADVLKVKLIGHQWWWEVRYIDWPARFGERYPSNQVVSANEIHVPVDAQSPVTVEVMLESHDVIHSFWVPSLHGKRDLIPGHATTIYLRADRPGTYWGECAEFCGYQHANMRIAVVAQPVAEFAQWIEHARQEAPEPTTDSQRRGRDVFLRGTCAMCHTIGGTEARATVGPNLTHVAARQVLGAGAVPNVNGHLAGWILDPQKIKPGVRMPQNNLSSQDLRALLDYLETLK